MGRLENILKILLSDEKAHNVLKLYASRSIKKNVFQNQSVLKYLKIFL